MELLAWDMMIFSKVITVGISRAGSDQIRLISALFVSAVCVLAANIRNRAGLLVI